MRTSGTLTYRASCQLPVCEPETTRPAQRMRVLGMLLHSWEYLIGELFYILWMQDYHFLQSLKHLALLWHNPLLDISKKTCCFWCWAQETCVAQQAWRTPEGRPCFAATSPMGRAERALLAHLHMVTKNYQRGAAKTREHVTMCCRLL